MGAQVPGLGGWRLTEAELGGHVPAQGVGGRAQEGALHQPSAPCRVALMQGRQDRGQGGQGGGVVAKTRPAGEGLLVRGDVRTADAALGPEDGDVEGRQVDVRPLQSHPRDAGVDQPGEGGVQGAIVQARALQGAGSHVGDEDVGVPQYGEQGLAALGRGNVEGHAALAPVLHGEDGIAGGLGALREEGTGGVSSQGLHLDHIGTPVGHDRGTARRGDPGGQLDDLQSLQKHGFPPWRLCASRP